jgi:hypothetical protein
MSFQNVSIDDIWDKNFQDYTVAANPYGYYPYGYRIRTRKKDPFPDIIEIAGAGKATSNGQYYRINGGYYSMIPQPAGTIGEVYIDVNLLGGSYLNDPNPPAIAGPSSYVSYNFGSNPISQTLKTWFSVHGYEDPPPQGSLTYNKKNVITTKKQNIGTAGSIISSRKNS